MIGAIMIATTIALMAVWLFAAYAKRRSYDLAQYEIYMNSFIQDATSVLNNDDIPATAVTILAFMRQKATNEWSALHFFMYLLSRDRSKIIAGEKSHLVQEMRDFFKRNPKLAEIFARACAAAFLAMTYRGGLVGAIVRRLVFFDAKKHSDRASDIAAGYTEAEKCNAVA